VSSRNDWDGPLGVANPVPARGTNSGGGYGRLRGTGRSPADGSGESRPRVGNYPYTDPVLKFSTEETLEFYDEFLDEDDIDSFVDGINSKINRKYVPSDPSNREDRASLVNNQLYEYTRINEKSFSKVKPGPAPFSHRDLYPNGFTGPALGGFSTDQSLTVRPGTVGGVGTQYGTSRAPLDDFVDYFGYKPIYSFSDVIDFNTGDMSDMENVNRQRRRIQSVLEEIDEQL